MTNLVLDAGILELGKEPLLRVSLGEAVVDTNATSLSLLLVDTEAAATEDDEEIHTVDTDSGVVLNDIEINVLLNTETEVTGGREVARLELTLLAAESKSEDLLGTLTADGDVASDLLVTADTEGTDGKASLGEDGLLTTGDLLKDLGGAGKAIT
jgi:hypothetical protein